MGNDTGIDPDIAGTSSICLCDEYPAECKPDEDRSCGTGIDNDTGQKWGKGSNYTLCLNSSQLGYGRWEAVIMEGR